MASSTSSPLVSGSWWSSRTMSMPVERLQRLAPGRRPAAAGPIAIRPRARAAPAGRGRVVVHQQNAGRRGISHAPAPSRAEADPGELLPAGLAPPRVPQSAHPPVQRELAVAEVLQHGIQQQDQDLAAAAEGQQMALQPVGQAVAETPGAHQHREDVDQYPVAERGEQECPAGTR